MALLETKLVAALRANAKLREEGEWRIVRSV
jgi:hypothetical protein